MTRTAVVRAPGQSKVKLCLEGAKYECLPGETVLEALLRQGASVPYSCRKGVCLSCMLKCSRGEPPPEAQEGLRDSLRLEGYFLACSARPDRDLDLQAAEDGGLFSKAKVAALEPLTPEVCRLFLEPTQPFAYRPGQFVNLRRADGLVRSYSLTSVPHQDETLELHVKRLPEGRMSNWLYGVLTAGDEVDIQGPNGACYYLPGRPTQPLLLIGNGTGLAPLLGILRDSLNQGHSGEIRLYHGSRTRDGIYLRDELRRMARRHANVRYVPCVSRDDAGPGFRQGRAEAAAFSDLPDLTGWRVYLCGYPPMVHGARKTAYLAGVRLEDIYADPFELSELRHKTRP
jgi:ferredoxin-NADP reductase/ferredoxin